MVQGSIQANAPEMRPLQQRASWAYSTMLGALVAAAVLAPLVAYTRVHAAAALEDDGFYYAQIARAMAATGRSSFDGLGLTNGYHPLWLLVLAAKTWLFGDATWSVIAIEALFLGGSAALIVRNARVCGCGPPLIFAALFSHYVGAMSGLGMEVSLFALCAGVFIALLASPPTGPDWRDGLWLGAAAGACIGARIDSAVFVAPMLLICARPRLSRLTAFAIVGLGGLIYGGVNLAVFGSALPVSSAVKSLGGLQVNHRFIAQMAVEARAFGRHGGGRMLLTLAGCAIAPLVALLAPRGSVARTIGLGTGIGGVLFLAKLLFDSSWQIWPWYSFPLVFSLATALHALGPRLDGTGRRVRLSIAALGAVAVGLVGLRAGRIALSAPAEEGFYAVNRAGAAQVARITDAAPVAMGDRAGSFAWFYPGPVVQLEGLVNDARWFKLLKTREPPLPELCRRGVRFVVGYTPDLATYDSLSVPLVRPHLTQYAAPVLTVRHGDELAVVRGAPTSAATDPPMDNDPVLRLWRLHCDAAPVAPAPPVGAAHS